MVKSYIIAIIIIISSSSMQQHHHSEYSRPIGPRNHIRC